MMDAHAPDLIDTLNRRGQEYHAAPVRDLKELAENRPGDFLLLLFEAIPDDEGLPSVRPRRQGVNGRRAP